MIFYWEYLRDTLVGKNKEEITNELNALGKLGWELILYQPLAPEINGYYTTERAFVVMKRLVEPQIL